MPAPLQQPSNRTGFPPKRHRAAAHLGRVSVVMMARVNPSNDSAVLETPDVSAGTAAMMRSTRIGNPITPVEHTSTCSGADPSARADLYVDHIGPGKYFNRGQFHLERRPALGQRPSLVGGGLPLDPQRPRRQHTHVRVRIVVRHEFTA